MRYSVLLAWAGLVVALSCLAGCGSSWSWSNDPPVIGEFSVNGTKIGADERVIAAVTGDAIHVVVAPGAAILGICRATDPNGDPLTFTWTASGITGSAGSSASGQTASAAAAGTPTSTSPQVFVGTAPTAEGIYDLSCAVSDGRDGVVARVAHIQVLNAGLNPQIQPGLAPATVSIVEQKTQEFVCHTSGSVSLDDLTFSFFTLHGTIVGTSQKAPDKNEALYTAPAYDAGDGADNSDVIYCVVNDKTHHYGVATATVTVTKKPPPG